jgi:glycosidase
MFTLMYIGCSEKEDPLPDNEKEEKPVVEIKPFDKVPSLTEMVMYEVNPLAFGPNGTFINIEEKLEHIKGLGVNVIWLMPIFPKGIEKGVGSPYAVMDYTDVNPDYGTLDDFKQLIKAAHELEMAVIIDWVANHTSWDNNWIDNEGWYVTDASGNIINPPGTNWQDVAELNFNNMEMRAEMINSLKFWIDQCNIDGFRFDAVDFVPDAFWYQALDSLKKYDDRNLILLAEGGKPALLNAGFQLIYGWDFQSKLRNIFHSNLSASDIHQTHKNEYQNMGVGKQRLRYITNHDLCAWDESPVKAFVNARGSVAAFAIATFMGGVPLIYNGQEIAWPDQISFFNFNPLNWNLNRDIYTEYAEIINIRQQHNKTVAGSVTAYPHPDVVAFGKTDNENQLLVLVNTRQKTVVYEIPAALTGKKLARLLGPESTIDNNIINLQAFDYYVFKIE